MTLRYERGVTALDDVSLTVEAGSRVCVLGTNGSGKSTLASVCCGLLAPDEGEVTLAGERVYADGQADFAAYGRARRKLGLVFQNPDDQIVTSVVEDDVAFGPENLCLPPEEIGRRVERELHRVALTAYAKANPAHLSGGQRQRLAIASALAMRPEVLVLDEPSSALDVRGRHSLLEVMRKLREAGVTLLHVTHFMEEALEADRVIVLDRGHVVLDGTPEQVFSHVDELRTLGLEEPFAADLSARLAARGLPVTWTCSESDLASQLLKWKRVGAFSASRSGKGSDPFPHVAATVEDVSYSYSLSRSERRRGEGSQALSHVSLTVPEGASVALVGQTGSGKSTLLRLLCALEVPDEGHVRVGDADTRDRRGRRLIHGRVGYVMQRPERQLFAETVRKDVAFGPTNMGLAAEEVSRRVDDALALVGLTSKADASPFELSGGQRRKCAIAGILAMRPRMLVLDEPTAGLDPRGRNELRGILSHVHEAGTTVVEVTHAMENAALADVVFVLDGGRVVLSGSPHEVFSTKNEATLTACGLGLPAPLAFARSLEQAGAPSLDDPLTQDALADALAAAWEVGEHGA